jgi:hypothetical protein
MNLVRLIPSTLLFVTAVVFIIKANVIFYRILDDVNASRTVSQQISFMFVNSRFGEVMSEHGEMFPKDPKRRQMKITLGIGFGLLALSAIFVLALGQNL